MSDDSSSSFARNKNHNIITSYSYPYMQRKELASLEGPWYFSFRLKLFLPLCLRILFSIAPSHSIRITLIIQTIAIKRELHSWCKPANQDEEVLNMPESLQVVNDLSVVSWLSLQARARFAWTSLSTRSRKFALQPESYLLSSKPYIQHLTLEKQWCQHWSDLDLNVPVSNY